MIRIRKALVVEGSEVLRNMSNALLCDHSDEIIMASDREEAGRKLHEHRDLDLVLCDVILPDGSGFQLLEEVRSLGELAPSVILMTGQPLREDAKRAREMGAVGYLAKPIAFREIVQALEKSRGRRTAAPRVRRRPLGRAYLVDPVGASASATKIASPTVWDIRDMSVSGAFLETRGPIEVGTLLDLCLDLGRSQARVRAQTVRVQEPGWGRTGGVGITFRDFDVGSQALVVAHLAAIAEDGL